MSRLTLARRARHDLARLVEFLVERDPVAADATVDLIMDALLILENHPRIGRPTGHRLRELIIHRGRSGYIALYRVSRDEQDVEVLAIRHQRESGYHQEDL